MTVQFDILRTGDVDRIVTIDSEPRGNFDEAAIAALAKRHYPPEQLNNGSCNQLVEVFEFTLGE